MRKCWPSLAALHLHWLNYQDDSDDHRWWWWWWGMSIQCRHLNPAYCLQMLCNTQTANIYLSRCFPRSLGFSSEEIKVLGMDTYLGSECKDICISRLLKFRHLDWSHRVGQGARTASEMSGILRCQWPAGHFDRPSPATELQHLVLVLVLT